MGKLPLTLLDALRALEQSTVLASAFGAFIPDYLKLKHREWASVTADLIAWERSMTLDRSRGG